jgi:hypothetical protein
MAGGVRKHGTHRYFLATGTVDATSAATAGAAIAIYDAYSLGNSVVSGSVGLDQTTEVISEINMTFPVTYTGQATNFNTVSVVQWGPTGTVKNQFAIAYSAAGVTSTLLTPITFQTITATGQTPNNVGTGTVTVTGSGLPWSLATGDQFGILVVSTGTGQAIVGGLSASFTVQAKGA